MTFGFQFHIWRLSPCCPLPSSLSWERATLHSFSEKELRMPHIRDIVEMCSPSPLPFKPFCSTTVYKSPAGQKTQITAKSSYFSEKNFESDLVKQGRRVHQKPPLPRILGWLLSTRESMLKCLWFRMDMSENIRQWKKFYCPFRGEWDQLSLTLFFRTRNPELLEIK